MIKITLVLSSLIFFIIHPMPSEFWKTQPVDKNILLSKAVDTTPIFLPHSFYWAKIDDISSICQFLENFYVEDTCSNYRLSYSENFFRFLFSHPKHKPEYSLGLIHKEKLVGYILAREHDLVLRGNSYTSVSINFLCIDKKFRNKSFAPLMIKEITRIANLQGVFHAIFTAEKDYGFGICKSRYFHYPINAKNLLMAGIIDYPEEIKEIPKLRDSTVILQNPSEIYEFYHEMCKKFILHEKMDKLIFENIFKNNNSLIAIHNQETKEFASFFIINTNCIKSNVIIKRAYLYYWAGTNSIISDAISIASSMQVDMFDVLNVARNYTIITELQLIEGSGTLNYHLFNLKEKVLDSSEINFILF